MEIMQTFLPYPDFKETARCLDYRRLGKQRVEATQIINILEYKTSKQWSGKPFPWSNHPAVLMWSGFLPCLCHYTNIIIEEWINRGYKNTMTKFMVLKVSMKDPPWLGDKDFHDSHKSNLLRKDPKYYSQYDWNTPNNLAYIWPT